MNILVCSLSSAAATIALTLFLRYCARNRKRTWDDYYPHLREFDWKEARILFDHEEEDKQKSIRDAQQFRRDQRARLDLALELLGRAYHNTRLTHELNTTEWCDMIDYHLDYDPALVDAMRALRRETRRFKWIALFDLSCMWLLSVTHFDRWRFLPVPSIVARRKVFSDDILHAYERVRQAAAQFARLAYSDDEAQLILAKM